MKRQETGFEIAIIGMSGKFPGAVDIEAFWSNLERGVESITFLTDDDLRQEGVPENVIHNPDFVKTKGGEIAGIDLFDRGFFGYTAREAEIMDPQLRLFHEFTFWALENAGYDPFAYEGAIGIYAGALPNFDWQALVALSGMSRQIGAFAAAQLTEKSVLCTRVAYKLNLKGPAVSVQTACSTSLVAVHMACRALLTAECDMAVAGGVSIAPFPAIGYVYQDGMIASPDGHCRAFDADAGGTNGGSGIGLVVLKRLKQAIAHGDTIHAVILGSAINNDGIQKVGFTAPSVEGQRDCIKKALKIARIEPETIGYVEAHGTGTHMGDPIEIEALTQAFATPKREYCAIGSVKTNVGHLDRAAGVAGLIKAVLSLENKKLVPSLFFERPNPKIDFKNSPFFVNTSNASWEEGDSPRRAAVSSFGIGGTNAHIILEEAPMQSSSSPGRRYQCIVLSAMTSEALEQKSHDLCQYLENHPNSNLADIAYTLHVGRRAMPHRRVFYAANCDDAVEVLKHDSRGISRHFFAKIAHRPLYFMFPGQGAQYVNMGLDLYNEEPAFREELERCFSVLRTVAGFDPKSILFDAEDLDTINQTQYTQPLLFSFEYALAKLLIGWGIKPDGMIGHSLGEYVAACLAGVFTLEDALAAVASRGRLMQKVPRGSMLSVPLSEEELSELIPSELSLAAVNSRNLSVVSGACEAIVAFREGLLKRGIESTLLHTSHAFHSAMMEPILAEFEAMMRTIPTKEPSMPFASNVTGHWITTKEAMDPCYWTRQLRGAIRFAAGLDQLLQDGNALLVEVGPGNVLSTFARKHHLKQHGQQVVNLVRHPKEIVADDALLLQKVGELWMMGQSVDWRAVAGGERRLRIPLPLYPFHRERYWIERDSAALSRQLAKAGDVDLRRQPIDRWFYAPAWKQAIQVRGLDDRNDPHEGWLLFSDRQGIGDQLAELLAKAGNHVISVQRGTAFEQKNDNTFIIDPSDDGDFSRLMHLIWSGGKKVSKILHLWSLDVEDIDTGEDEAMRFAMESCFHSLNAIARACDNVAGGSEMELIVTTSNLYKITGQENAAPLPSLVRGPCMVIPKEFPGIRCRHIDLSLPNRQTCDPRHEAGNLYEELSEYPFEPQSALRGRQRWVMELAPVSLPRSSVGDAGLRPKGVYLVSGGLGGMALEVSLFLAKSVRARLALVESAPFPSRDRWDSLVKMLSVYDPTGIRIRKIQDIERHGAEVLVIHADVTRPEQIRHAVRETIERFGTIHGVFHAAGAPDGKIIQQRTREYSEEMMAAKVSGTVNLICATTNFKLDFFIACSSLNSYLGSTGQVAYCSANAFLNACAGVEGSDSRPAITAIAWDSWKEVGMAARMKSLKPDQANPELPKRTAIQHYLFDSLADQGSGRRIYYATLDSGRHWIMGEHRIMDTPTLPATAYLEMIRAAMAHLTGTSRMELRDVFFLAPLAGRDGAPVDVTLETCRNEEAFDIKISSSREGRVVTHATATVVVGHEFRLDGKAAELNAIKQRLATVETKVDFSPAHQNQTLQVGGRWRNLTEIRSAGHHGQAVIALPPEYTGDLDDYLLHPAMLDSATSFMIGNYSGRGMYVPFSYRKITIFKELEAGFVSIARQKNSDEQTGQSLEFDITLLSPEGGELVDIEGFTLVGVRRQRPETGSNRRNTSLDHAITNEEGIEIFRRALAARLPVLAVSTRDFASIRASEKASTADKEAKPSQSSGSRHQRPDLSVAYAAPTDDIEERLCAIWAGFLGLDRVGVHDDFFELGVDSLQIITVSSRIHREMDIKIPVSEIFNRATVRALADFARKAAIDSAGDIAAVEARDYYPLSSAQKRLFIHQQLAPHSVAYNLPQVITFASELDLERWQSAFDSLLRRHEILRTSFALLNGEPVQVVHQSCHLEIQCIPAAREEAAERVLDFIRPFDLARAPLVRSQILHLGENHYVWLFDIHHIASDATGIAILQKDLFDYYEGKPPESLEIQYRDYAVWQNALIESGRLHEQENYWTAVLAGAGTIAPTTLPYDFRRPAVMRYEGKDYAFVMDAALTRRFNDMGSEAGVTLFMNLLAVLYIMLHKYTGNTDMVVGSAIAGRSHADLEKLVGMFVNLLPMRVQLSPESKYLELLRQVKELSLQAFANQDVQFESLVEALNLPVESYRNPLFDVCLNVQNYEQTQLDVENIAISEDSSREKGQASKFDLTLWANPIGDRVIFNLEYSTELYKKETMDNFSRRLLTVIASICGKPDITIEEIQIFAGIFDKQLNVPEEDDADFAF